HLRALAATNGVPRRRVEEVIDIVGLHDVAGKRAGGFSLGMGQRLGIASALLGDPQTLLLDEPVNGLDPEGVLWIRNLLKSLASEGRTIFVSSHLMSEMALTAEHLIVIGKGRLIADCSVADLTRQAAQDLVTVGSVDNDQLRSLLVSDSVTVEESTGGDLEVSGLTAEQIGRIAASAGLALTRLTPHEASLEEAFMSITRSSLDYVATINGEAVA
ncbi:MAG: AAA family ATPase, partial [Marmoricola sp.]